MPLQKNKTLSLWWGVAICTVAALFYCYEYLLRIIPGVMEPQLRVAFGSISATAFGTLSAYYYFAYTPLQLPVGILMDRFGPRRLLIAACLLCAFGSWLFTYMVDYTFAAIGRFLVGFGSAFAFVGVLALAINWLPKQFFSMVAGVVTMLGMLGAIIGQMGMTVLVTTVGWQTVLGLAVLVGLILTVLMIFVLRDTPERRHIAKQTNFRRFFIDSMLVLKDAQMWLIGLVGSLLYLSLSVFAEVWGKTYLMMAHGLNNLTASSSVSMVFLGWAIGAPSLGLFADLLDRRITFLVLGALLSAVSISWVLYVPNLSLMSINILLFCYGFFCSVEVVVFTLAKNNCEPRLAGTALAAVNMIVMLGGVIFQPLVGKFLDYFWNGALYHHMRVYSHADYQLVLSFLPLSLLGVAIATFFLRDE